MSEPQQFKPAQEENLQQTEGPHPLSTWTKLREGAAVELLRFDGLAHRGTVESRTGDGLIIWVRDDLNERRLFHYREIESVRVLI